MSLKAVKQEENVVDFSTTRGDTAIRKLDAVDFSSRLNATFTTRLVACGIDGIIYQAIAALAGALLGVGSKSNGDTLMILVTMGLSLLYFVVPVYHSGQTLGKKIMKIKVVSTKEDESDLGIGQVIYRETFGKIVSFMCLGLGYLNMLWSKDKKTWHDKMAGTEVIALDTK